jgi:polysaccharide export outer membrane protein
LAANGCENRASAAGNASGNQERNVSDQTRCGKANGLKWILVSVLALTGLTGCEVDSFLDPSTVGRWEQTPVEMPVLSRIDVIEQDQSADLPVTRVRPSDLVPSKQEYTIGPGDLLTVSVFELLQPGTETTENRRVDQTGMIRLPVIGEVQAAGDTPSELERHIADVLQEQQVLRDATVSVVMQQSRHNTFSVISEASRGTGGVGVGTYTIPKPNFRLLDALAMAQGVPGRTKKLLVFRQSALAEKVTGAAPGAAQRRGDDATGESPEEPAPQKPSELIEDLMGPGGGQSPQPQQQEPDQDQGDGQSQEEGQSQGPAAPGLDMPSDRPAAPQDVEAGLEEDNRGSRWAYVNGEWVRADRAPSQSPAEQDKAEEQQRAEQLGKLITQRIIEIPYSKLIEGDMRYNIIVRPGDVIKVPSRTAGFVYAMGAINRPGAYSVPGEQDLTLTQLIASAGGLSQLAIPERVDLQRRVGDQRQAIIRLNVRAIFEGRQPDVFLKPNDLLNFGTSFAATPLAIFRNGLRMTYGFGFILDRNFNADVFGPPGSI